jgi:hypothetical protein
MNVVDRVVQLLNSGITPDEVFHDVYENFYAGEKFPKQKQQAVADYIAQVHTLNVFATGTIPPGY